MTKKTKIVRQRGKSGQKRRSFLCPFCFCPVCHFCPVCLCPVCPVYHFCPVCLCPVCPFCLCPVCPFCPVCLCPVCPFLSCLSVVSPLAPDTIPQFDFSISTCYSRYCVHSLYNSLSHALPCTPCPRGVGMIFFMGGPNSNFFGASRHNLKFCVAHQKM